MQWKASLFICYPQPPIPLLRAAPSAHFLSVFTETRLAYEKKHTHIHVFNHHGNKCRLLFWTRCFLNNLRVNSTSGHFRCTIASLFCVSEYPLYIYYNVFANPLLMTLCLVIGPWPLGDPYPGASSGMSFRDLLMTSTLTFGGKGLALLWQPHFFSVLFWVIKYLIRKILIEKSCSQFCPPSFIPLFIGHHNY